VTVITHAFSVRVYYEDTDHGGIVYYANYLKFMERARTEFLRDAGIELDELESVSGIVFAVTEAHVHYLNPARFNDVLIVDSTLIEVRGARMTFQQQIRREAENIVESEIRLACMDREGRPRRIPAELRRKIQPELTPAAAVREPA